MPSPPDVFGFPPNKKQYLPVPPKIWPHGLLSNDPFMMMPTHQMYNPQYETIQQQQQPPIFFGESQSLYPTFECQVKPARTTIADKLRDLEASKEYLDDKVQSNLGERDVK